MKYIDCAINRLNERTVIDEKDLSLIERILVTEKDPNLAGILALDLILVGIDTVSTCFVGVNKYLLTIDKISKLYIE